MQQLGACLPLLTEISEQMQKLLQHREIQTKTLQCLRPAFNFSSKETRKKMKNIGCEISYMHRIKLMNEITYFG